MRLTAPATRPAARPAKKVPPRGKAKAKRPALRLVPPPPPKTPAQAIGEAVLRARKDARLSHADLALLAGLPRREALSLDSLERGAWLPTFGLLEALETALLLDEGALTSLKPRRAPRVAPPPPPVLAAKVRRPRAAPPPPAPLEEPAAPEPEPEVHWADEPFSEVRPTVPAAEPEDEEPAPDTLRDPTLDDDNEDLVVAPVAVETKPDPRVRGGHDTSPDAVAKRRAAILAMHEEGEGNGAIAKALRVHVNTVNEAIRIAGAARKNRALAEAAASRLDALPDEDRPAEPDAGPGFGTRLGLWRGHRKLTRQELAARSCVNVDFIYQAERADDAPARPLLTWLEAALEVGRGGLDVLPHDDPRLLVPPPPPPRAEVPATRAFRAEPYGPVVVAPEPAPPPVPVLKESAAPAPAPPRPPTRVQLEMAAKAAERRAEVVALRAQGLSLQAVSEATGLAVTTVVRHLRNGAGATPPRPLIPREAAPPSLPSPPRSRARPWGAPVEDAHKQSLYFPQAMLDDIRAEGRRLDRSASWVVQRAWVRARRRLRELPTVVEPGELGGHS
jgi:uncharacterized small protein (TIGR04563 family)